MKQLPPTECLACFEAAAGTLNFGKAAKRVHLSPAAFGQRIRQLEELLGLELFVRTTRKVSLSDAGHRVLPQIRKLLREMSDLAALGADQSVPLVRDIQIGTRHELGLSWLLPLLPKLEARVPGTTIHLRFGDSADLLLDVEAGEIDAAICSVRMAQRTLSYQLLHKEMYQLVASPKLLSKDPIRSLEAALSHTLIDVNAQLPLASYWLDADKDRSFMQFEKVRYLGTIRAIRDFVLRGAGIAVLPSYFVEKDLRQGRLATVLPSRRCLTDNFRLLYPENSLLQPVFHDFAELMRKAPLR